jgi:hypothetical protein
MLKASVCCCFSRSWTVKTAPTARATRDNKATMVNPAAAARAGLRRHQRHILSARLTGRAWIGSWASHRSRSSAKASADAGRGDGADARLELIAKVDVVAVVAGQFPCPAETATSCKA